MFGNDSFGDVEDLFNQLAKQMGRTGHVREEYQNANSILLSKVDGRKERIFIFDFSGKNVKSVAIKEDSDLDECGRRRYTGNKIMEIVYDESEVLKYVLPEEIRGRNVRYKQTNGILEVILKK